MNCNPLEMKAVEDWSVFKAPKMRRLKYLASLHFGTPTVLADEELLLTTAVHRDDTLKKKSSSGESNTEGVEKNLTRNKDYKFDLKNLVVHFSK